MIKSYILFQTVAIAARRVPDDFCGVRSPFSLPLINLGQVNRLPKMVAVVIVVVVVSHMGRDSPIFKNYS
jgi:hypothetical protein